MEIIFYTTGCPKCQVLKKKLEMSNLNYKTCSDIEEMSRIGLVNAPALKVDNEILNFKEAVGYVNKIIRGE